VQNVHDMSAAERVAFDAFAAVAGGDDVFAARLERHFTAFHGPLVRLYGDRLDEHLPAIARLMERVAAERDGDLRRLDFEREITPDWFQRPRQVGYICYVDRFAGTLPGVRERLPYLQELGVSYLHLMPLLRSREGPNDGGYAVADYRQVEPALGTVDDLRALAADLHGAGMSLCVDLVLNHTAREHEWARRAMAGEEAYRDFYLTFEDRTLPDAYERTLPLVFPDLEPGNFTWSEELGRWVWTTFNRYQWDLDYTNPAVFVAMLENLLELANTGVDALRLDAVPFMWKRLGTDCQNQPEVHELLAAFRAIARVVAPGVIFKAEAIVSPHHLVAYLGECELAYHNSLMVLLWSALASRRVSLMTQTLDTMPGIPPGRSWITYVRCHDDIGWAITEDNAAAVGEDAHEHRKFLVRYFSGDFWESFARGAVFEPELNGEGRTSGTAASLAGVELALERGDETALELARRRLLLLYAVAFSYGGLPLIYMGDELGLRNDDGYARDPLAAGDNRWLHRPHMDWQAAARRGDAGTLEGRLFAGLRELVAARRAAPALHAAGSVAPQDTGNPHVFGFRRDHGGHAFLALANFSEHEQAVAAVQAGLRVDGGERAYGSAPRRAGDFAILEPYGIVWLTYAVPPPHLRRRHDERVSP
jgi:amylosucrase